MGLIIDCFAGGGGASVGIEAATGRNVDVAINHDAEAIAMHEANHPETVHHREDIVDIDPLEVTKGRPVDLIWFSPDCTYHSKARGGKPFRDRNRARRRRGLAWIVPTWLKATGAREFYLENVEEFANWGPLLEDGKPCPERRGLTFRRWWKRIENLGYKLEMRELRACDYGAPTIRKRLFIIGRNDGRPIVWPKPTHGDPNSREVRSGYLKPWRTAAECIDFTLPCPSIFLTKEEGAKLGVRRPLKENTLKRIARGIDRYVINAEQPFIVTCNHGGDGFRGHGVEEPFKTVTAHRDGHGLVTPIITDTVNGSNPRSWIADEPLRTQCAEVKGGHFALLAPFITRVNNTSAAERNGVAPATDPVRTVHSTANGFALVQSFLAKHFGGNETPGWPMLKPISTLTAQDHHALVTAHMTKFRTGSTGADLLSPVPTITAGPKERPAGAPHALGIVTSNLMKLKGTCKDGQPTDEPASTIQAQGNHVAEVRAMLMAYYSCDQDKRLTDPMHTISTRDRFGLVTVRGIDYQIVDIGMRMLQPRELFNAQGFPADYKIDITVDGKKLSKSAQVRMCGNSVCPVMAEVLIRANAIEEAEEVAAA